MKKIMVVYAVTLITIVFAFSVSWAGPLTVPNTFSAGSTAMASDVNANFDAVEYEVTNNDGRISDNASDIATNESAIAAKQSRVNGTCTAGSSIRAVNTNGSVQCETDDVGVGDITGVTAGVGLSGGGTSGNVTLSLANSGLVGIDFNDSWWNHNMTTSASVVRLGQVNLTVPGAGHVLLFMGGNARIPNNNLFKFGIGINSTNTFSHNMVVWPFNNAGGDAWDAPFNLTWVVPVHSQGTVAFHALVQNATPAILISYRDIINLDNVNIVALFVPRRY